MAGDFLLVNKAALGSRIPFTDIRVPGYSEPRRGEIRVIGPPHEDTLIVVKRLIGMPGDTLEIRGMGDQRAWAVVDERDNVTVITDEQAPGVAPVSRAASAVHEASGGPREMRTLELGGGQWLSRTGPSASCVRRALGGRSRRGWHMLSSLT